ncbi:hypothetical protein Lal_00042888 [Lupinus albus]|nr:hypothetical protein Lal_00042888 [Lupinus albus]
MGIYKYGDIWMYQEDHNTIMDLELYVCICLCIHLIKGGERIELPTLRTTSWIEGENKVKGEKRFKFSSLSKD